MQLAEASQAPANAEAWHRSVEAHAARLWCLALAVGLSPTAAAETCELVWLRLGQLRGRAPADPGPWLDAQVRRESAARLRLGAGPHHLASAQSA
jgi:DNA-directed RNA polymerase specialized sigma24 family protein